MKILKLILSPAAFFCLYSPVINGTDRLKPDVTVESYKHDKDKDAVLKLLQENSHELGFNGDDAEWLADAVEECLVLTNAGKVVGFSMFTRMYEEGHIRALVISEQCRNRGFGQLLLKSTVEKLKSEGATCIVAAVYEDRIDGGTFWIKQGFKVINDPVTGKALSMPDRDSDRKLNGYALTLLS